AAGSDFGRTLCFASGETQGRGSEAAGGARRDGRAGVVADAHEWLPVAGGDRQRAPDLPTAPQEGRRGHRGKDQEPSGSGADLSAIDFEKAVAWCEQRTRKTLAPSQREALKTVLGNRVVVITG